MDLEHIIRGKGWFVITATREKCGSCYSDANLYAKGVLERHLDALGLAYVPCTGFYRGEDQGTSFFVIGGEETARLLCDLYSQESVLVPAGLIDAKGRPLAVRTGDRFGAEAHEAEFHSAFGNGLVWSAVLEFI